MREILIGETLLQFLARFLPALLLGVCAAARAETSGG
jgi:hypothetical protein